MVYDNVIKSSIYTSNKDGRLRIRLKFSDNTHKKYVLPEVPYGVSFGSLSNR